MRLGSAASAPRRLRQPIRERQIRQRRSRPARPRISRSASGSRSESRLNAPRRTTTRTSSPILGAAPVRRPTAPAAAAASSAPHVLLRTSPYSGCATQTSTRSSTSSSLIRPRRSASSTASGELIRCSVANSIGSPTASASTTSRHRGGQIADTGLDQLDQARRHDRLASPLPVAAAASPGARPRPPARRCAADTGCCPASASTGLPPYPAPSIRPTSPTAALVVASGDSGSRSIRSNCPSFQSSCTPTGIGSSSRSVSRTLADAPLHDLLQHEHRQVIEKVRVVDADHHRGARRRRGQRFDDLAHQVQTVAAGQPRPRRQGAERNPPPA